jgi:hypothetical protein
MTQAEVNAYIKDILKIEDITKYNIIVSDSVYNSMSSVYTSEVYVYKEEKLFDHALLKKFYGFMELEPYEIKIPDSIAFSHATTLINTNDFFFITDSKFSKYIFVRKNEYPNIIEIKASDLTNEINFNRISGDTMCYHFFSEHRNLLRDVNMDVMRLNHTFSKDNMSSIIMAPDITVENNEVGLTYKSGVIIFKNPYDYSIFRIREESIPTGYFVFPGFFYEFEDKYYLQLVPLDKTLDDQYILGRFTVNNEELLFSEFLDYKLPSEYLPASKFKSLRKILTPSGPYIFLQYSLSYFDLVNDKPYLLPLDSVNLNFYFPGQSLDMLRLEYDFKFVDAYTSESNIQVLYEKSNKYFIALIDRTGNQLIEKKEIREFAKPIKAGLSFYSKDMIFYLSQGNSIVVEKFSFK